MLSLKVFFILTEFFTKLIITNANGAGSLRLSRNYRAKTFRVRRCDFDARNITRPQL